MQRTKQHNEWCVKKEYEDEEVSRGIFWNFKKLLGAQEKMLVHKAIPSNIALLCVPT